MLYIIEVNNGMQRWYTYIGVAVLSVVILCEGLGYLVISEASYLHYIIVILAIMLKFNELQEFSLSFSMCFNAFFLVIL